MSQLSQPGEQELSFPLPLCSNQVINGLNDSHARYCLVAKLYLTLCNPPGSSVHEISQARILEWVAISFSRGSSQPRDRTLSLLH